MDSQAHTIACGFAHSCAISSSGKLYCWGDNANEQMKKQQTQGTMKGHPQYLDEPELKTLKYKNGHQKHITGNEELRFDLQLNIKAGDTGQEYKAIDVAAGPNNTFVIGIQQQDKTFGCQVEEEEIKEILGQMKKVLDKWGSLLYIFYAKKEIVDQQVTKDDIETWKEQKHIKNAIKQDPYTIEISKTVFINQMIKSGICNSDKRLNLESFVRTIIEHRDKRFENKAGGRASEDHLILGDLEDFAMGFLQNNIKLYMFGQAHQALTSFENKEAGSGQEEEKTDEQREREEEKKASLGKRAKTGAPQLIKCNTNPMAIQFPRFTKPLMSVAVGSAHALVLTIDQELYSWGCGSYGALGFGSKDDVSTPSLLVIRDYKKQIYKISQICCGKQHSLCLTSRQNIFSWGESSHGRLGQGDNMADELAPKEIYALSQRKPIFISAGESNSAAITETNQLYTWGNGVFGRLGHQDNERQTSPKLVESLIDKKIVYVSMGAFHTLCVDSEGDVYSFGQNKYGKLGIHYQNTAEGQIHNKPVRISMFKGNEQGIKPDKKRKDVIQVAAGFNHSMALCNNGRAYSWGYKGKGLLGRKGGDNRLALPVGQQLDIQFNQSLRKEQQTFINERIKMMGGDFAASKEKPVIIKLAGQDEEIEILFYIKEICCGSTNTMVLTSNGDVYVLGNNRYGQHGTEAIKCDPIQTNLNADQKKESIEKSEIEYDLSSNLSKVSFPFSSKDKIQYISMGGEHLFAQSSLDQIFAWGRNEEGQLGVGFFSEKVAEPYLLTDLSCKGIKQITCCDNYSAALTIYGDVFVTGSLEGGKLGLGKGQRRGFQLNFRQIKNLPEIDYIAGGIQHMLAISRKVDNDPKSGNTFSWGKNQRGQLGLGTKDNMYNPCEITSAKEKLVKVCCGHNYSLGLSVTGKVYFWGNRKYFGSFEQTKDVDEPLAMKDLEKNVVTDITCNYKQCIVVFDKGEMKAWGKFLHKKYYDDEGNKKKQDQSKRKGPKTFTPFVMERFPESNRFSVLFESIITGQNHAAGIAKDKKVYIWGYNNVNNRLGVRNLQESKNAESEPQIIGCIQDKIEEYLRRHKLHLATAHEKVDASSEEGLDDEAIIEMDEEQEDDDDDEGRGGGPIDHDDIDFEDDQQINSMTQGGSFGAAMNSGGGPGGGGKSKGGKGGGAAGGGGGGGGGAKKAGGGHGDNNFTVQMLNQIEQMNVRKRTGKRTKADLMCIFDPNVDIYALECIRLEIHVKQEPSLAFFYALAGENLTRANVLLQKTLKKEDSINQDEKSIALIDAQTISKVAGIIKKVISFSKSQRNNDQTLLRQKSCFLGRAVEKPFGVDIDLTHDLRYIGLEKEVIDDKKRIQEILTLYAIHPCYTIQLLKSDLFTFDEQKMFIKQLFSNSKRTATSRNNYYLISVFEAIFKHELEQKILGNQVEEPQNQLCLFDKECKMISVYIFRRVIKSQHTNLDTICSFCCHILNNILVLSSVGGSGEDNTLDVNNETVKDDGNDKKGSTGGNVTQKSQAIVDIVKKVIEELLNNQILKETGQQFGLKKKFQAQLEFIKKQFKDTEEERRGGGDSENPQAVKDPTKNFLAGIDNEEIKDKFPSIRFSEELLVMIGIMHKQLSELEYQGSETVEEEVCTQILGLIFIPKILKIQENFALYLYPYASKVKQVYQIDDQLKKLHMVNVKNIFMCVISYIKGEPVFQGSKTSSWCQKMNQKLTQHQHANKPLLLKKMLKFGNEISQLVSYKNFENMVSHCLEQDETKVSMSKKLLGTFVEKLQKNIDRLVIQSPSKNDLIFKIVQDLGKGSAAKLKAAPDYDERVNLKLKTRIMVKHDPSSKVDTFVRCRICNVTLTQDIAIQNFDESIVLPQYEPQDMLSLVTAYCDVLRKVDNMNLPLLSEALRKDRIKKGGASKHDLEMIEEHLQGGMMEFVKQTETIARREANYQMSDMIQLFKHNLNIMAENMFRQMEKERANEFKKKNNDDNAFDMGDSAPQKVFKISDDDKVSMEIESKERVFKQLLQEAQDKIHQRITQKFNLQLINTQIERYLTPMINAKIATFKEVTMDQNQLKSDNYQWGLANRDLLHLIETQGQGLAHMTKVAEFTQGQKKSKALDSMLAKDQKQKIRGYLQIEAKKLLANKTIRKSRLVELGPLLEQSTVVLIEADNGQSIEFKLVFKQKKASLCGPDRVLQEQIILKFDIPIRKLKEMRQKKCFSKNEDPKDEDQEEFLVFEENDALEFDPQGFIRLISQMERQKMAYTILQEGMDGTVSSIKKEKKTKSR